ncbi:MAG: hydrogenase [Myxococcales bacterium]|nr:hydrogenase [Myxococcales bacterium]
MGEPAASRASVELSGPEVAWGKAGGAWPLADVPELTASGLRSACLELCRSGARLSALCALGPPGERQLWAVVADDVRGRVGLAKSRLGPGEAFPSVTSELPQAQAFERELIEAGVAVEGHPWPKALRRHRTLEELGGRTSEAPPHPFFQVEGPGIHEVAVGPVHAGIIEPGHFRFQCHGEKVLSLEIQLGYQHRGAEELLMRSPPPRRLSVAESIAGDTAVGHALAYCAALEALSGVEPPQGAQLLRGVALELERLHNHVGDLGALCNDVGYLPGASWFGRLRGEMLNALMELSGNRFGRGLLLPGGVRFGATPDQRRRLLARLPLLERDLRATARLTFDSASVASRFDHTGVLSRELAAELGLVGPAARASGRDLDLRRDHPAGIYRSVKVVPAVLSSGDVHARAMVRWLEVERSLAFVQERLEKSPERGLSEELPGLRPSSVAVSMVEGFRGEILHLAVTDSSGAIAGYKVVDPSFHNWFGLAMAMRGNHISDFPLCNKSFNLSYAGHDL